MKNIVLIGMPGCGKSTVAPLLGRPFYDTDAEVERGSGRSIPDIFASGGEEAFRKLESQAVERLSLFDGIVVATGGGVVKSHTNMQALKRSGFVVFLNRPFELINTGNAERPLLGDPCKWKELYSERLPLYKKYADIEVKNDGTPQACAQKILEELS